MLMSATDEAVVT